MKDKQEKRVLIATGIFPPEIGGPASYASSLAERLSKEGLKVTVITYSSASKKGDKFLAYKVVRIWKNLPRFFKHLVFLLRILIEAKNSDVIYSLNIVSVGVPAAIVSRFFRKKLVVRVVGDYAWDMAIVNKKTGLLINDFQSSDKKGWTKILHKSQVWVCKKASHVIVPSECMAKIVQGWGIKQDKIKIIYTGSSLKISELTKEDARKKIGIPGNIIISSGRLIPLKGFRMLIKIMPQLLNISQFFRLVIVGEGPDKKMLEAMVRNLGLDRKVYLVGKKSRDELAVYLAASDIYILGSGFEAFPQSILEAMSAGVPVIATAVGGNKEIIKQGENGFLVRYNDEFNIVEAIKTLWESQELRDEFVENGKKTTEGFSVEKMYDETLKLLNS